MSKIDLDSLHRNLRLYRIFLRQQFRVKIHLFRITTIISVDCIALHRDGRKFLKPLSSQNGFLSSGLDLKMPIRFPTELNFQTPFKNGYCIWCCVNMVLYLGSKYTLRRTPAWFI